MNPGEKYCMKWSSYQKHIGTFLSTLCESEVLADVTIWAENQKFNCHRVILSACSPYFHEILSNTLSKHPVIVLAGVNPEDFKTIIYFIYHGEVDNIPYERFISVLKTAELLQISGLTEVIEHIPPRRYIVENLGEIIVNDVVHEGSEHIQEVNNIEEPTLKKRKPKKPLKSYSERSIGWAISDMEKGMSLVEAARLHKIPRSTLYAKVRRRPGLRIARRKKDYAAQDFEDAVQAVAGGLSLKRASEQYGIPKTVLWRKVQQRLDICSNLKSKKRKKERRMNFDENETLSFIDPDVKLCLQSRESDSSNHSNQIKSFSSEHNIHYRGTKQHRLAQALNACKEGKMSQAVASKTFQVPKTLIWRRLQKAWPIAQNDKNSSETDNINSDTDSYRNKEDDNIRFISNEDNYSLNLHNEEGKNIMVKNENKEDNFSEASSLIILTSANEHLTKEEPDNDDELLESLNVSIENVVEVVSDKEVFIGTDTSGNCLL
ncbi:hypothetical protein O3M35_012170 [Rhynocoris fuscipes]|uniref:BTB domain-containing protein n=1 Tax=Rhynocoris fuscipes TaxID=488301 RepID=A0AAW1CZF4_9HEMI